MTLEYLLKTYARQWRAGLDIAMNPALLRNCIGRDEFDSQTLLNCLRGYKRPRDKISDLLDQGIVIRIKKGIYVFGEPYRRGLISRELLANWIYGPSYLSLEFALQHHGMIPEAVERISSVCLGRSRTFVTPVGQFSYRQIAADAFSIGVDRVSLDDGRAYLIATPEKALADKIAMDREGAIRSVGAMRRRLVENLRIDPEDLDRLDSAKLAEIAVRSRSRQVRLLHDAVKRIRERTERAD